LGAGPIGGLADRFGRLPTIRLAACLCVLSVGALAYVHDPIAVGAIMAVRAIAITACVTAEFAYASTVVAPERAVSATATLGMVGNLSLATAPAAGFWLWQHEIERQQFLWAAGLALVGALILLGLPAEKTHAKRA
jgi:MFS family permease